MSAHVRVFRVFKETECRVETMHSYVCLPLLNAEDKCGPVAVLDDIHRFNRKSSFKMFVN